MDAPSPPNGGRILAYAVSALTTLLWVACVLPAGELASGATGNSAAGDGAARDAAMLMHRERTLLVPALVLLVVCPAGLALSRTRTGLLSVLAATDAFIAFYAAVVLSALGAFSVRTSGVLVAVLLLFGALSVLESIRLALSGPDLAEPRWRGLRFALCLLVLLTPSFFFLQSDRELASLLAPFALLAISTGGAAFARTLDGLRLTAALGHVVLALHVLLTLRFTLFERGASELADFETIGGFGWIALGLSVLILLLGLGQALRLTVRVLGARADPALADPTP